MCIYQIRHYNAEELHKFFTCSRTISYSSHTHWSEQVCYTSLKGKSTASQITFQISSHAHKAPLYQLSLSNSIVTGNLRKKRATFPRSILIKVNIPPLFSLLLLSLIAFKKQEWTQDCFHYLFYSISILFKMFLAVPYSWKRLSS